MENKEGINQGIDEEALLEEIGKEGVEGLKEEAKFFGIYAEMFPAFRNKSKESSKGAKKTEEVEDERSNSTPPIIPSKSEKVPVAPLHPANLLGGKKKKKGLKSKGAQPVRRESLRRKMMTNQSFGEVSHHEDEAQCGVKGGGGSSAFDVAM